MRAEAPRPAINGPSCSAYSMDNIVFRWMNGLV